jgi:undecaprenyl-diphosphatase
MNWLESLILGCVQGVTEFLPVSSSAHLKLAKFILGIEPTETSVIFDLMCHFGTLIALLWVFRKDIIALFSSERKKLLIFFLALAPLVPFYFFLKPLREYLSQMRFLGWCLMATSLLLYLGTRIKFKLSGNKIRDALVIGTMQSTALIPGVSRSAATISAARVLGWSASEAVRFSFLLSIPTIIGGNIIELYKTPLTAQLSFSSLLIGFLSSLAVGMLVIRLALTVLEKGKLRPFAWYCFMLGLTLTIYMNFFYDKS